MNTRITHFSLIFDFIDIEFSSIEISKQLKSELDLLVYDNLETDIEDWLLIYNATYTNSRNLLVSRNRLGTSIKDKIKEIKVAIPIPTRDKVTWGVSSDQYLYCIDHYDAIIKNFWTLDSNYTLYNNRSDYIVDSLRRGIKKSLSEGITVGGKKIKISKTD